jgi:DNA mismatch repair protein MutS
VVLSQAKATRYAGTSVSDSLTENDAAPAVAVVEEEFALSAELEPVTTAKSGEPATTTRSGAAPKSSGMTPLMQQYATAKQQHPGALLFFRLGDFYELFFEDAQIASRELQLTLTSRDKERGIPMCGVPYHAAENYIPRLLRKGYRVAVCEQMEEPGPGKKLVRREVTRVLSPGTAMDPTLAAEQSNFLVGVCEHNGDYGMASLELSTGEFLAEEFRGRDAAAQCHDAIQRTQAREVLFPAGANLFAQGSGDMFRDGRSSGGQIHTGVEDWAWSQDHAIPLLLRSLGAKSLDGFGLEDKPAAACAAGALLYYVKSTQPGTLEHVRGIRTYERRDFLQLDTTTVRNLELVEPLFTGAGDEGTLFRTLDACRTPMGKRLLRASILQPLFDPKEINRRLDAVGEIRQDLRKREELREALNGILDLDRLLARVALESAGPREIQALAQSLGRAPLVKQALQSAVAELWTELRERVGSHEALVQRVTDTLVENPPAQWGEGGFIREGLHAELDEFRSLSQTGRQYIAAIEERERKRTGIGSLKVRFNSVFGYYIEITKANLHSAPADYERKQTLVNAERFTTPELKEYEVKVLQAQEQSLALEKRLFAELRQRVLADAGAIRATSQALAEIDMLACFAHLAALRGYTRPTLTDTPVLEAAGARHPVIEELLRNEGARFIPNDLHVDAGNDCILLITGPNMGGKSTYLRQAALLMILAQMGSFVPASAMRFGPADRIYTRIGAADNVARGRSTFMVEMTETATILNTATPQSLILLDEMGRGTATYDGLSLAWATVEFLHNKVRGRALFATHYHELTLLEEQLPGLRNLHVTCKESPSGIVFLHALEPGPASQSYGIEVARLAGIPATVLARARQVLRQHESAEKRVISQPETAAPQLTIFTPLSQRIVDRLQETDVNSLTPLQALNLLEQLQRELRGDDEAESS